MEPAFVCGLRDWTSGENRRDGDEPSKLGSTAAMPNPGPSRRAELARLIDASDRRAARHAWPRRLPALALFALAVGCAANAGYLHAKAALAQVLLQRAFDHQAETGEAVKPWPWADTLPVARLVVPSRGVEQIVLEGDSGRTLAFGPGWAPASAAPGRRGTIVVSGHRDTHFSFLRELAVGEEVQLQTPGGNVASYRIAESFVADSSRERITPNADADELLLVTCWPFDAVVPGGPMRFVARAIRQS